YLLDKLTDQLFIMEGEGHVKIFNGNYSSYRYEQEIAKQQAKNTPVVEKTEQKAQPKKGRLSFKEIKELENLDKEIALVENKIKALTEQLNSGVHDHSKLIEIAQQIAGLNDELDGKSIRWIELTELNEA
ncbi:MAG: family ATP-binding cassette protein, partial [Mucilaginibacter sp.]|nr:family ATP-binding cassette protein [Mucilaginibacter sp.]